MKKEVNYQQDVFGNDNANDSFKNKLTVLQISRRLLPFNTDSNNYKILLEENMKEQLGIQQK